MSTVDEAMDFARFGYGPGIGPGPAYPLGRSLAEEGTLQLASPRDFESRHWGGQKVLWFVRPGYRGRVLIRGRARTPRGRPSFTRLRAPGCYGYQIDGATFSRVIVFRARWAS